MPPKFEHGSVTLYRISEHKRKYTWLPPTLCLVSLGSYQLYSLWHYTSLLKVLLPVFPNFVLWQAIKNIGLKSNATLEKLELLDDGVSVRLRRQDWS